METKTKFTLNEVLDTLKEKKINRDEYSLLYSGFETQIGKEGYLQFRVNEKDKWKNVHTLVNQYFNSEERDQKYKDLVETGVEKWLVTHHVNFFEKENKLNNHPDNLQWLGWDEHTVLHKTIMREIMDKMWNPENIEYCNFEEQREKIRLTSSKNGKKNMFKFWTETVDEYYITKNKIQITELCNELWYGKNNEEHRKKMLPILLKNGNGKLQILWKNEEFRTKISEKMKETTNELWHGENNQEFRNKMLPIAIKNISDYNKIVQSNTEDGEKLRKKISERTIEQWNKDGNEERRKEQSERTIEQWNKDGNEEKRKEQSERIKKISNDFWYLEENLERREKAIKDRIEFWSLDKKEERSKQSIEYWNNPVNKRQTMESRVFITFNKIIKAGEEITNETFLKHKSKFGTYPETVFGSIENAIEKYKDYPKRIKI